MEFGFVPLNILFFHANRLSRSRIGWAQTLRGSILASILRNASMDNFCHPNLSEVKHCAVVLHVCAISHHFLT